MGLSSAQLQYEGFEPTYEPGDNRAVNLGPSVSATCCSDALVLKTRELPEVDDAPKPLFTLERVQYTLPAPLVALVVSSNMLVMGLSDNRLVMFELTRDQYPSIIQLTRKPTEMSIYKMFFDPSGRHLLVTSTQGETWYIYVPSKKPKHLKSWKMIIESVAWNRSALLASSQGNSTSSREILIGAKSGTIYEALLDGAEDLFKSTDRYLHPVFSMPEKQPITGLRFAMFPPLDPKKALVVATTPTRIYQFVGAPDRKGDEGKVFTGLFASYRDATPSTFLVFFLL
jgi:vacuolar protein sorting-associated protein 18